MGEGRDGTEGVSTPGLFLRSENVWKISPGRLLPPMVGEETNAVPGNGRGACLDEGRLHLSGFVCPDRCNSQPVVIGSSLKGFEGLCPSTTHAGSHCEASTISREERDQSAAPNGFDERSDGVVEGREVHGDTVTACDVIRLLVTISESEEVTNLKADALPHQARLVRSDPPSRLEQHLRQVDADHLVPEARESDCLRSLPTADVEDSKHLSSSRKMGADLSSHQFLAYDITHRPESGEPSFDPIPEAVGGRSSVAHAYDARRSRGGILRPTRDLAARNRRVSSLRAVGRQLSLVRERQAGEPITVRVGTSPATVLRHSRFASCRPSRGREGGGTGWAPRPDRRAHNAGCIAGWFGAVWVLLLASHDQRSEPRPRRPRREYR